MPYIDKTHRPLLDPLGHMPAQEPGELNFQITRLVDAYIDMHGMKYTTVNAVIGVLISVAMELYRRIIAPYEDWKILQNGDVYTVDPLYGTASHKEGYMNERNNKYGNAGPSAGARADPDVAAALAGPEKSTAPEVPQDRPTEPAVS